MKTISYDPKNYTVIDTIEIEDKTQFQKIQFPTGNYGILYHIPEHNIKEIILLDTSKNDTYINVFMETLRNQTEILNHLQDGIDEVELHLHLNTQQSETFKQIISKETADDLIGLLKEVARSKKRKYD